MKEQLEEVLAKHKFDHAVTLDETILDLMQKAYELGKAESKWVSTSELLPPIDDSDKWNKEHEISFDVFTCSKYGMIRGRYYYQSKHWSIDNVTSSQGIEVTHWQPLPEKP